MLLSKRCVTWESKVGFSVYQVSLLSFDDTSFYLGDFRTEEPPRDDRVLFVNEPNIKEFLEGYWGALWNKADSLNEGGDIKWEKLKRIATRLGMTDDQFKSMKDKVENEALEVKEEIDRGTPLLTAIQELTEASASSPSLPRRYLTNNLRA